MQHMTSEAHKAALAGEWAAAIRQMDEAATLANAALSDVVNLARTVGGLSDKQVADIRGTSPSAVTQRFGARSGLLRDAMAATWEAARTEWAKEGVAGGDDA